MAPLTPNEKLLWALIEKSDNDVKKALDDDADANLSSPTGSRPLHVAALRGSASLVNILLECYAKVDQADFKGFTPLMVAALNGKTDAVRVLLAKGANPNMKRLLDGVDTGQTALHLAMNSGSQKVVAALLDGGADINAQTKDLAKTTDKFTPLHFAALFNARDLANVLLGDPLCDAAIEDSQGRTAAVVAKDEGHNCLARHLDMCTMKRSKADQELVSAVMELEDDAARRALAAGANANLLSPTGSCLLHAAALRGSASLVNIFLNHGAKVNQADFKGFTPLMVAALNGSTDVVRALLAKGADPNLKRLDSGETALHMAMNGGSPGVVNALLEGGADINAQTTDKEFTPLHFAALFDARDLIEILQTDPRCNVKITDIKGRTAAQLAEEKGNEIRELQDTPDGSMTKVRVTPLPEPMQHSESVHKVTSLPRGRVLVLNYEKFEGKEYRSGAVWDAKKLGNLFTEMGYDVSDVNKSRNLNYKETNAVLRSFRGSKEMGMVDCAVVCVLSHGKNKNTFITSDDKEMTVEEVYDFFTDDHCPNLKGKPKLFLFNFCRGRYIEPGCILDKTRRGDDASIKINKEVSPNKGILEEYISLYASREGITALRDVWKGTYFTEAVVKIFAKHAHNLPVDKLADMVNEYMKTMLAGTTTSIDSNTSKKFYLNPTREQNVTQQHT